MIQKTLILLLLSICACNQSNQVTNEKPKVQVIPAADDYVFIIKPTNKPSIGTGLGDVDNNELWLRNTVTKTERLIVSCKNAKKMENVIGGISEPHFSIDRKKVFFQSEAWATSAAIHVVDLKSGKEKFICPGNGISVIEAGKYKGDFITFMHKYYGPPNYGSFDHDFIVDENGKEIKDLKDDESIDNKRLDDLIHGKIFE